MCVFVFVFVGTTERQTGRERERETVIGTSFRGQCEPREKANDLSGAQMYSVPEVIRAVT